MGRYPQFAGVHINIEPMPSGNAYFITLLEEIRSRLAPEAILSVAGYPPPTRWQPSADGHWDRDYYAQVCGPADQVVVMMYDTALQWQKVYRHLMGQWTREILLWTQGAQVLLGVPAYDDAGVDYHNPEVENLRNALAGIHGGLAIFSPLPQRYEGVAIYSEWEMGDSEWRQWQTGFIKQD